MKPIVLSIVRREGVLGQSFKEFGICVYAGILTNKHIYAKLITENCKWPEYIRIRRRLTYATLDEEGKGTMVRKLILYNNETLEFSKYFRELTRDKPDDIPDIEEVDRIVATGFYNKRHSAH